MASTESRSSIEMKEMGHHRSSYRDRGMERSSLDLSMDGTDYVDEDYVEYPAKRNFRKRLVFILLGAAIIAGLLSVSIVFAALFFMAHVTQPGTMHAVLASGRQGAVSSDVPICSDLGVRVLQELGGNAADAAVTVALCVGLVNGHSSGVGGGAVLLVRPDDTVSGNSSVS